MYYKKGTTSVEAAAHSAHHAGDSGVTRVPRPPWASRSALQHAHGGQSLALTLTLRPQLVVPFAGAMRKSNRMKCKIASK